MNAHKTAKIARSRRIRRANRLGAYTVEMAIGLPIVFLAVLGGLELIQLSKVRHAANQAAYEAARRLVIPGGSSQEATTAANHILRVNGLSLKSMQITPSTITRSTKDVTVQLTIQYRNEWSFARIVGGKDLFANCTLAHEYSFMFPD